MNCPRIIIAGSNSGAGKTTIAMGLMLALKRMGLKVQPFKAGPDYIDPSYHTQMAGSTSANLDSWLIPEKILLELFQRRAEKADISVIEGVMGLYDGFQDGETGSTSHIAKILKCPVILIINAGSLSRSAGAIALGYKNFDGKVNIAGVILNNIGSQNHYKNAKNSVEKNTDIPVLGFLPKDKNLKLPERHLGLIPSEENKLAENFKKTLLNYAKKYVDLNKIIRISKTAGKLKSPANSIFAQNKTRKDYGKIKLGIAKDCAFNFYYDDNLYMLKSLGAKLYEFSPLESARLPEDLDGLYIGGGFPELFAERLSNNLKLKMEILKFAELGMPVYAECGGLMYLAEELFDFNGKGHKMTGVFDFSVKMGNKLQALGYAELNVMRDNLLSKKGEKIKCHFFHWSYVDDIPGNNSFVYRTEKNGRTIYDGIAEKNVFASYAHLHFGSDVNVAENLICACGEYKKTKQ